MCKRRLVSSEFDDAFVRRMSPSDCVRLVTHTVARLSSSQDTLATYGDMNSCGCLHGGDMHVNSYM